MLVVGSLHVRHIGFDSPHDTAALFVLESPSLSVPFSLIIAIHIKYFAIRQCMCRVVTKKKQGRENSRTKARQYRMYHGTTTQNRCDAHEDYRNQHPSVSSTKKNTPLLKPFNTAQSRFGDKLLGI